MIPWLGSALSIGKGLMSGWKVWAGIIGAAAIIGTVALYVRGAEQAKARAVVLEDKLGAAEVNLRRNQAAMESCLAANAANAVEAARQKERANQAEIRLAADRTRADRDVEDTERDEVELRATGLDCPAITAEFRSLFGDTH